MSASVSLRPTAVAAIGPWGPDLASLASGDWPSATPPVPRLPGFVESTFNPLLFEVARKCLEDAPGDPARTAVILGSLMGDATTFDLTSQRMLAGQVHNPLLFIQATSNSVLGYVSKEFGITGPMSCLCVSGGLAGELLLAADLLLATTPDVDRVLLLGVELASNQRTDHAYSRLNESGGRLVPPPADLAVALLVDRGPGSVQITSVGSYDDLSSDQGPADLAPGLGAPAGLVHLALACAVPGNPGSTALAHDPTAPTGRELIQLSYSPS